MRLPCRPKTTVPPPIFFMDYRTYLYPEKPKLISIGQPLFAALSNNPMWVAEPKYNGSRLVLSIDGEKIEFWNRHGRKFGYAPPDALRSTLMDFQRETSGWCLFDGELRHNKVKGIRDRIVIWDVLVWDGKLLVGVPYWQRRTYLPLHFPTTDSFRFIRQYPGGGNSASFKSLFREWTQDPEIEGMVIKNLNGKLNLSRTNCQDSNWMVKVRRPSAMYRF